MKTNKLFLSVLTIFSLSAAACSGDDKDSGGGIDSGVAVIDSSVATIDSGATTIDSGTADNGSGVDGTKALTDLDAAEKKALCDYTGSLFPAADAKKIGCLLTGLFSSESAEQCQMVYDACIAEPDDTEEEFYCPIDENLPECAANVTVAEMEVCARDQAGQITSLANSLSCASLDSEFSELDELSPSCQALETKCPALFEADES